MPYPSDDSMSGYPGGYGGRGVFDPDEDRKVQFRRLYKTDLGAILKGFGRFDPNKPENSTGLAAFAAATADKNDDTFFQEVAKILVKEQLGKMLDDEEATFATLRRSIATSNVKFRGILEGKAPGGLPKPLPTKPAAAPEPAPAAPPAAPAAPTPAKPPAAPPAKTP